MARPIIIDTDPGQDDAVALLLAFAQPDELDIRLVSTVAGNVRIELTAANALRVRDLAARPDVPVQAGMARPMLEPLETAEFVSGPDGLSGAGLPPAKSSAAPGHAVQGIVDILRAASDGSVTICALGPLTNVAMALRLAPELAPRLREIVVMGGAMGLGNMTPAAEFNFYVDPHAAAVVFGAGVPV
ncbi:MAG: nucleoside hydrolase, partial [Sphingomonadaceae bacterium]